METTQVTHKWYVEVHPLPDIDEILLSMGENLLGGDYFHWGPFSTEEDAEEAQRILRDTPLGDDLSSTIVCRD